MRVLMIFVDGFGLGEESKSENPYMAAATPFLDDLLSGKKLHKNAGSFFSEKAAVYATDAILGVPGIPQSATGQSTIWTGINAPKLLGKHLNGFPNKKLRDLIYKHSIFLQLAAKEKRVTFANAYRREFFEKLVNRLTFHSASTSAVLAAGLRLRTVDDLIIEKGVYQDITNEILVMREGEEAPIITPDNAGTILGNLSKDYDFTLFEYFQTDVTGHKQDFKLAVKLINRLDSFLGSVIKTIDLRDTLIMIVSDHGNIEDINTKGHTTNFVPTILISEERELLQHEIKSLTDISPYVLKVLTK